jgi:hypothetical protein
VVGLFTNYYVICKAYMCSDKKCNAHFLGYDTHVLLRCLPAFIRLKFPCQLTHKGAMDRKFLHFVERAGASSKSFASIQGDMTELQHLGYFEDGSIYYHFAEFQESVRPGRASSGIIGASSTGGMRLSGGAVSPDIRRFMTPAPTRISAASLHGSDSPHMAPVVSIVQFGDITSNAKFADLDTVAGERYLRDRFVEHAGLRKVFIDQHSANVARGMRLWF